MVGQFVNVTLLLLFFFFQFPFLTTPHSTDSAAMTALWTSGVIQFVLLLVVLIVAQDYKAKFNTPQCQAFRDAVSASYLPSAPCFDRQGGAIGIRRREV